MGSWQQRLTATASRPVTRWMNAFMAYRGQAAGAEAHNAVHTLALCVCRKSQICIDSACKCLSYLALIL